MGFRYSARNGAAFLGLTGWVYNDYDGTVLMEVQGRKETIDKLLNILERRSFIIIDRMDRNDIPVISEGSFVIRDY